ncbi:MAG: hypothetical protein AAGH99_10690 [Planctomycetota bacterium]
MAEAVLAGDDFDEGAEVFDAGDGAGVEGAFFDFGTELLDFFEGLLGLAAALKLGGLNLPFHPTFAAVPER